MNNRRKKNKKLMKLILISRNVAAKEPLKMVIAITHGIATT
jgi:hypothetical protein